MMSVALTLAAATVSAQATGSTTNPTAKKTAQSKTAQKGAATKAAPTKAAPTKAAPMKGAATATKKGSATPAIAAADTAGPPPTIWREEFVYDADHRRDPFNSLLTTNELRPTLSDLKITGILFDPAGRRSFATLRDLVTNAQYRVTNGTTLGRMRVAAIRTRIVVFTIDEFGTTRQDSLVFGDTTKARVK
jgi:hypothetical protein